MILHDCLGCWEGQQDSGVQGKKAITPKPLAAIASAEKGLIPLFRGGRAGTLKGGGEPTLHLVLAPRALRIIKQGAVTRRGDMNLSPQGKGLMIPSQSKQQRQQACISAKPWHPAAFKPLLP